MPACENSLVSSTVFRTLTACFLFLITIGCSENKEEQTNDDSANVEQTSVEPKKQDTNYTAPTAKLLNENGTEFVVLENDFVELTFEPSRGGRCTKFLFKDNGEQLIANDDDVAGMFLDHWAKYSWPSALMHLPYEHEILEPSEHKVGIRLKVTVPEMGGGKGDRGAEASNAITTSPELVGLVVQKTIWLHSDSDLVTVDQEVINPTDESRATALYLQQNLGMNGSYFSDNWYLPSTNGVEVYFQADKAGGSRFGPDFIQDPVEGWIAVKDRNTDRGLLFVFDYNYLQQTYTSGGTGEWFMDQIPIAPGKSFATQYLVKPVSGLEDFAYGSERVVANIQADEKSGDSIEISHSITTVSAPLQDVDVEIRARRWVSKEEIWREQYQIDELTAEPHRWQGLLTAEDVESGLVLTVTVRSAEHDDQYEYYYAGDKAEADRRSITFATKGRGLPGARGDAYVRAAPRKHKAIDKPDFDTIERSSDDQFRCLVVFGLYTHILNLDDAFSTTDDGQSEVQFVWANCPPNAVETFPGTYDELFNYDVIVLADVNARALGDIALEMLCDYVHEGGTIVVSGGPYAYGNGEFQGTRFLEALPVHISGPFDLKWAGKGMSWSLKPAIADHAILDGVSFDEKPQVFWQHYLQPKRNSEVILTAGDKPALVVGNYGKGQVAALSLSPTGVATDGEVQWWDWNGWFPLVRNLFNWAKEVR